MRDIVERVYNQVKNKAKAERMAKDKKAMEYKAKKKKQINKPTMNFKENIRKQRKMLDEF